jgi:hypothetical protein
MANGRLRSALAVSLGRLMCNNRRPEPGKFVAPGFCDGEGQILVSSARYWSDFGWEATLPISLFDGGCWKGTRDHIT